MNSVTQNTGSATRTSPSPSQSRERPILFSGEMVRAILEGRKTQTRRTLGPRWTFGEGTWRTIGGDLPGGHEQWQFLRDGYSVNVISCPYGQPGDRLWVRESMARWESGEKDSFGVDLGGEWFYRADETTVTVPSSDTDAVSALRVWAHHKESPYCPSIHMPRWASRITLEITKVRVERVQEITEADIIAEGISKRTVVRTETEKHRIAGAGHSLISGT